MASIFPSSGNSPNWNIKFPSYTSSSNESSCFTTPITLSYVVGPVEYAFIKLIEFSW